MIRSTLFAACLLLSVPVQAREKVSIALDWTLNTNHVGLIAARDRGYYDAAGLEVEILPAAVRIIDCRIQCRTTDPRTT